MFQGVSRQTAAKQATHTSDRVQYAYRCHAARLHTVKQERATYGEELDITVELMRKRGVNVKRVNVLINDEPEKPKYRLDRLQCM